MTRYIPEDEKPSPLVAAELPVEKVFADNDKVPPPPEGPLDPVALHKAAAYLKGTGVQLGEALTGVRSGDGLLLTAADPAVAFAPVGLCHPHLPPNTTTAEPDALRPEYLAVLRSAARDLREPPASLVRGITFDATGPAWRNGRRSFFCPDLTLFTLAETHTRAAADSVWWSMTPLHTLSAQIYTPQENKADSTMHAPMKGPLERLLAAATRPRLEPRPYAHAVVFAELPDTLLASAGLSRVGRPRTLLRLRSQRYREADPELCLKKGRFLPRPDSFVPPVDVEPTFPWLVQPEERSQMQLFSDLLVADDEDAALLQGPPTKLQRLENDTSKRPRAARRRGADKPPVEKPPDPPAVADPKPQRTTNKRPSRRRRPSTGSSPSTTAPTAGVRDEREFRLNPVWDAVHSCWIVGWIVNDQLHHKHFFCEVSEHYVITAES